MKYDLTTRSRRLGWFSSKFAPTWLDLMTGAGIIFVLTVMVANIAYIYVR